MKKEKTLPTQTKPSKQKNSEESKRVRTLQGENGLLDWLMLMKTEGRLKPGTTLKIERSVENKLPSGLTFDEEIYAKAKPHFEKLLTEFKAAGKSLREFVRFVVDNFSESIVPYLKQFHRELSKPVEEPVPAPETTQTEIANEKVLVETGAEEKPERHKRSRKPRGEKKPEPKGKELEDSEGKIEGKRSQANKLKGLTTYGLMAKAHWEKYRPKMVAELKRKEIYQEALLTAQETAKKVQMSHIQAGDRTGMELELAREAAMRFIRLPDEKEVRDLDPDLMPWLVDED